MRNLPIIRTVSAALFSFGLVAVSDLLLAAYFGDPEVAASSQPLLLGLFFALGGLYTHFFEYFYHRVPMHRGIGRSRILDNIKRNHAQHHRVFYGDHFQTRDAETLNHIAGRYWVFPILFFAHYALLAPFLSTPLLLAFLFGTVVHYVLFELTHWFTHVEDNLFDRAVAHVPFLSAVRERQIKHHRWHHEFPDEAFNFMPPYLGDWIASGQGARTDELPAVVPLDLGEPAPLDVSPAPSSIWPWTKMRPVVRYGSVAAASLAVVGLAVLAHGLLSGRGESLKGSGAPTSPELSI